MTKKQAVILYGSPHENGHTKKALNAVLEQLNDHFNFTFVNSYKEKIHPCIDCGFCAQNNKCIFPDFNDIDNKIRNCDLIIIASPVYNCGFPAPLKSIMDRTQLYFNMKTKLKINPFKKTKEAILVMTYGSNDSSCEEVILKQLELFFILLNAKLTKIVFVKNTDNK